MRGRLRAVSLWKKSALKYFANSASLKASSSLRLVGAGKIASLASSPFRGRASEQWLLYERGFMLPAVLSFSIIALSFGRRSLHCPLSDVGRFH